MDKAVLISIRPEWVIKILAGEKTLEVRKTRPKLETPFKVYIYCTAGNLIYEVNNGMMCNISGGKLVVGEFVCDSYVTDKTFGHDALFNAAACMTEQDVVAYSAGTPLYGWHISDLKIYDQPKPLSAFKGPCKIKVGCWECPYFNYTTGDCDGRTIKRPPQSWCYVEENQLIAKYGGQGISNIIPDERRWLETV